MTAEVPLARQALEDLLAAIGADAPAPGAGAASCASAALGVALLHKAIAVSQRHLDAPQALDAAARRVSALAERLLTAAAADARLFAQLLDPQQSLAPREALQPLLDAAIACRAAHAAKTEITPDIRPELQADLQAAEALLSGAQAALHAIAQADLKTLPAAERARLAPLLDVTDPIGNDKSAVGAAGPPASGSTG